MSNAKRILLAALCAGAVAFFELGVSRHEAHAIIGRPLTPMSYAGVARRTTRRAVAVTAATAPMGW